MLNPKLEPIHTSSAIYSFLQNDCVKSAQIRSYFWSVFSPNSGKCGPEITPYLDTFHAVNPLKIQKQF